MPIDATTVKALVVELARMMGDLVVTGTATGGSTSQLDDSTNLVFEETNEIEGNWVAIYQGAGIGDVRNIATYVTASNRLTPRANFSATIDTSSKYIVTSRWTPEQYLDSVRAALRRAQHRHLLPLDDVSGHLHELITLGDILSTDGNGNGQMEEFTSGVPDGWTADGNTTSVSDTDADDVRRGTSSYKMTSDGSNLAQITQAIKYYERYAGTTIELRAHIRASTDARSLIRVDDGPSTAVTDTGADGANVWEELTAELTVADDPTGIDIDCEISAGGAVNANFDDVRLLWQGGTIYEYDLPTRLVYLKKVEVEVGSNQLGSTTPNGWVDLPREVWKVQRGASPKLVFRPDLYTPPTDVHVRLTGQVYPTIIDTSAPTTVWAESIEINAEYVKEYAKWYLLNSLPDTDETTRRIKRDAENDWRMLDEELDTPVEPGSELVRVL